MGEADKILSQRRAERIHNYPSFVLFTFFSTMLTKYFFAGKKKEEKEAIALCVSSG